MNGKNLQKESKATIIFLLIYNNDSTYPVWQAYCTWCAGAYEDELDPDPFLLGAYIQIK